VIGEAGETIIKALGKYAETEKAVSLKQAVERAFDLSKSGEAVLLAPACTSFDMFDNKKSRYINGSIQAFWF